MREELTEREIDVILAYADNGMRIKPAARELHMDHRTIWRIFAAVNRKTGYNPVEFWDLLEIINARKDKITKGENDLICEIDQLLDHMNDLKARIETLKEMHEKALRDLKDCRNELCLKCGNYKERHNGSCDGCRWNG